MTGFRRSPGARPGCPGGADNYRHSTRLWSSALRWTCRFPASLGLVEGGSEWVGMPPFDLSQPIQTESVAIVLHDANDAMEDRAL